MIKFLKMRDAQASRIFCYMDLPKKFEIDHDDENNKYLVIHTVAEI